MKVVFMGTPEFAVASLQAIHASSHTIVGVVTAPDKPTGRGQQMSVSAVKKYAETHSLTILQPEKLRSPEFLHTLQTLEADVFVVVAFRMLPEAVWMMPPKGTINLHASLLPNYRGAAPINWAIINGETETGLSTFFIEKEIDTGNIIYAEKLFIGSDENVGELHDRMLDIGSGLVLKTLNDVEKGIHPQIPQDHSEEEKSAPKIFKETCKIDSSKTIQEVHNLIRGLSPYPGAWLSLQGKSMKILKSKIPDIQVDKSLLTSIPNEDFFFLTDKKRLFLECKNGLIEVLFLQLEGKKAMDSRDFLLGFRI
ncbi:MAG: methionyl-tRNA formyltransferase [Leadbetterella sp.]